MWSSIRSPGSGHLIPQEPESQNILAYRCENPNRFSQSTTRTSKFPQPDQLSKRTPDVLVQSLQDNTVYGEDEGKRLLTLIFPMISLKSDRECRSQSSHFGTESSPISSS
jgi:hypothetical protein